MSLHFWLSVLCSSLCSWSCIGLSRTCLEGLALPRGSSRLLVAPLFEPPGPTAVEAARQDHGRRPGGAGAETQMARSLLGEITKASCKRDSCDGARFANPLKGQFVLNCRVPPRPRPPPSCDARQRAPNHHR